MPVPPGITESQVVLALCGVITSLAGIVAGLYRSLLKQAREDIQRKEEREDQLIRPMGAAVLQLVQTLDSLSESQKEVVRYINEMIVIARMSGGGGGRGAP